MVIDGSRGCQTVSVMICIVSLVWIAGQHDWVVEGEQTCKLRSTIEGLVAGRKQRLKWCADDQLPALFFVT